MRLVHGGRLRPGFVLSLARLISTSATHPLNLRLSWLAAVVSSETVLAQDDSTRRFRLASGERGGRGGARTSWETRVETSSKTRTRNNARRKHVSRRRFFRYQRVCRRPIPSGPGPGSQYGSQYPGSISAPMQDGGCPVHAALAVYGCSGLATSHEPPRLAGYLVNVPGRHLVEGYTAAMLGPHVVVVDRLDPVTEFAHALHLLHSGSLRAMSKESTRVVK
ncbi:hypothetical protein QBC45DRAFT_223429 [Copromyces sp. CBS 386.78]|nr:hypothetical protein QBC45DRAFT_223429 [Copromyces sp. CBS 386.78]